MKIAIRVDNDRRITSHRRPDDQTIAIAQGGQWITLDSEVIGPIPPLPPYQEPGEGERRILTTGLVGTLCDDDTELQDETDEQRTSIDDEHDPETPFPEVYLSYMATVCTVPPTSHPAWIAARAAFEATLTNPSGGIAVPQEWVDARASYTDDEFKGWVAYVYESNGYPIDATGQSLRDIYLAGPGA